MTYLKKLLRENRIDLLKIYAYLTIYQILIILSPFFLGKAIDGLLLREWHWLSAFILLELVANIFMWKRMVFDTKIYTRIYNEMVLRFLSTNQTENTSSKSARTDMANMVIHFFEDAIPYYIMSVISIIGSIGFVLWTDWKAGLIILGCIAPIVMIVRFFYTKIDTVTRLANNHYERKVDMMDSEDEVIHRQYFLRRGRLQILRSTLQGGSWFWLNNTKTLFLAAALVAFAHDRLGLTQGEAIAMFSYINQFLISLMALPIAMEIWSMVRDVTHRLSEEC